MTDEELYREETLENLKNIRKGFDVLSKSMQNRQQPLLVKDGNVIYNGFRFKGHYEAGKYDIGDVVEHDGSIYLNLLSDNEEHVSKWQKLVSSGVKGKDAKDVEFRIEKNTIQWRRLGDEWLDLVSLSLFKGEKGDRGERGKKGERGEVGATGKAGIDGKDGRDGRDGVTKIADMPPISFRVDGTKLQYRVGNDRYRSIFDLSQLIVSMQSGGAVIPSGGTNGQVLTRDSTVSGGLKWATASGSGTGVVETIVAGTNITVDDTDPANPIVSSTGGAGVSDGDKGDITVSGSGETWTIDNGLDATKLADGSVTNTELQYISTVTSNVQTQLDSKVDENVAITGATKTKVTYDAKGLVTAGADATTADIADSSNKRYVTDAQLTVLGNTSGTNTGDQDLSSYATTAAVAASYQPLDSDLTTIAGLTATTDSFMQAKSSAWTTRTPTQVTADLIAMVGDSGSGGTKGLVPAPAAGDAAANKYLKANGTWATAGGQSPYDIIVDAAGSGHYTTLQAALAAASANNSIYIMNGSYSLAANTSTALAGLHIVGESKKGVIIACSTFTLTFTGAQTTLRDMTFTMTSGGLRVNSGATSSVIYNCYFSQTSTADSQSAVSCSADYLTVDSCTVELLTEFFSNTGIILTGIGTLITNCYATGYILTSGTTGCFFNAETVSNSRANVLGGTGASYAASVFGNLCKVIIGNKVITASGNRGVIIAGTVDNRTITGNDFSNANNTQYKFIVTLGAGNTFSGNICDVWNTSGAICVTVSGEVSIVSGNEFGRTNTSSTSAKGVYVAANNATVTGNSFRGLGTSIELTSASTGSTIVGNSSAFETTMITDAGVGTTIMNNTSSSPLVEKRALYMKNTSGASVAVGDIVTYKSVAAGNEFTTTTTAGDSKVYGMATATIANNASGYIQTLGKTVSLKVDGTTDIAVGDFISTFTTVGIGQKATTGQTAIAIALEAYTTNDSNGVIDALLIPPRLI